MNILNIVLIGMVIVLGIALAVVLVHNQYLSDELQLDSTIQAAELIDTFKEKYSDYEIIEYPDSKGIPYKYLVRTSNGDVELIFEKDRILLRAWSYDEPTCIVSNPIPRDILNNCPSKW